MFVTSAKGVTVVRSRTLTHSITGHYGRRTLHVEVSERSTVDVMGNTDVPYSHVALLVSALGYENGVVLL